MKFLFVDFTLPYLLRDSEYPVGGFAVQLYSWLKGLSAGGHRAGVLTWKGAAAYAPVDNSFDLLETYDPNAGIKVLKYFYSYIPKMLSVAKAYEPDVLVQGCAGVNTGIMAFIAQQLGVPFINRVASDAETDARLPKIVPQQYERVAYRYGLRRAAAVICQNQYQLQHLQSYLPAGRLSIIHNPFAVADPAAVPRPRDERKYVAWLGVFRKPKNLPLLLQLARNLPEIRFRVAGTPERNAGSDVMDAMAGLERLPNVEMAGYVRRNQVLEYLSGAVALLSTADFEGFSNTFLEAFSVGTPMVLRSQVDPDSIVSQNRLGLVAADDDALEGMLRSMWSMPSPEFAEFSNRCVEYVREHHDPIRKMNELIAILEPLVNEKRASASAYARSDGIAKKSITRQV